METKKDVICFSNEFDFIEQINSDLIEKLTCVKQQLFIEFEDYNVTKLICDLNIVDDMKISIIANDIEDIVEKHNSFREKIYV